MELNVRSRGVAITRDLQGFIDRRVRYALSRFGEKITKVSVQLADINGPRGGEDINCTVQGELSPRGSFFVSASGLDPFSTSSEAISRASCSVKRKLKRGLQRRRARLRRATQRMKH